MSEPVAFVAAESVARRGSRLLWLSIRQHPRPFIISVTGATLFSIAAVGGTIVLGRVTDKIVLPAFEGGVDNQALVVGGVAIILASVLRAVGVVMRRYWGSKTTRGMNRTWFGWVTDHYVDEPLDFFLTRPTGQLLAHTDADAERASMALQPLPFSLGVIVIIVFATINLAVVDLPLMLIGLTLFPLLAGLNRVYTSRVEEPAARAQAQVGAVSAVAHESFEAALIVKTLGLEQAEQRRVEEQADRLRQARLQVGRLRSAFEPALDALPSLGTVAVLALGAWRVSTGAITTGDVVQAMALFAILAFPMRVVGFLLEELPRAVVAHDRLRTVVDLPILRPVEPADTVLEAGPIHVAVRNLSFGYDEREPVLRSIDFDLAPAEVVALVGGTGSGKSTLCNLLARLVLPTSGEIRLNGALLPKIEPSSLRAAVAMVFQESFLFADTLRENLTLGENVDDEELAAALDIAQAAGIVRGLPHGLDEVIGERGVTLSGGQRQRVALARALLRRPRLLLIDDATSAVDPAIERKILDGLRAHLATTTLIVAHRVATIRLADRVLFLEDGRIAAAGAHEELMAHPGYEALVRAYEIDDEMGEVAS